MNPQTSFEAATSSPEGEQADVYTNIQELSELIDRTSDRNLREELETLLNDLLLRRDELEVTRTSKSPIRRIPPEILSYIMKFHVDDHFYLPWLLASVSQSWRLTALSTPRLWRRIHISFGPNVPTNCPSNSNFPKGIRCGSLECLETVISRSGAVPLHISIDICSEDVSKDILHLISVQVGDRWQSLQWSASYSATFATLWKELQPQVKLSNLRVARFSLVQDSRLLEGIFTTLQQTSPLLHTLQLDPRFRVFDNSVNIGDLRGIRHLELCALPTIIEGRATQSFWSRIPRLETLAVANQYESPFLHSSSHVFERLTGLAVKASRLNGLDQHASSLKALTHVCLEGILGDSATFPPFSVALVKVTHFSLINQSYRPLGWFYLPSLSYLEVYGSQSDVKEANAELDAIWNTQTCGQAPAPSGSLRLESRANDAYLLAMVRLMDNLQHLQLHYDTASRVGLKLLASLAVPPRIKAKASNPNALKKWKAPICPELKSVVIVCKQGLRKDCDVRREALIEIANARKGTASHIESLLFHIGDVRSSLNMAVDLLPV